MSTNLGSFHYEKIINTTGMFKLIPQTISGKVKLGQNWTEERYNSVINHLKRRSTKQDLDTVKRMEQFSLNCYSN